MKLRHKIDENILEKRKTYVPVFKIEKTWYIPVIISGNPYTGFLSILNYKPQLDSAKKNPLLPADMQALLNEF